MDETLYKSLLAIFHSVECIGPSHKQLEIYWVLGWGLGWSHDSCGGGWFSCAEMGSLHVYNMPRRRQHGNVTTWREIRYSYVLLPQHLSNSPSRQVRSAKLSFRTATTSNFASRDVLPNHDQRSLHKTRAFRQYEKASKGRRRNWSLRRLMYDTRSAENCDRS